MENVTSKDKIFELEQDHLTQIYNKLEEILHETIQNMEQSSKDAEADKKAMAEEITVNLDTFDDALETFADFAAINRIVDAYNLSQSIDAKRLSDLSLLLKQPYFAKIVLSFKDGAEEKELYIGTAGIADANYKRLIVDWRSPVAEVYYNQSNGPTSYEADGRCIQTDLKLRRQFDIDKNRLLAYFDTTVAIQDPLLLEALSRGKTSEMKAITATIQKEQNTVIRHVDVPVLLVNGIAGSGKSSVMMQRIAYLMYQQRGKLEPEEICLITPNPVFQEYISDVLPQMGESNPKTLTFKDFLQSLLPEDRGVGNTDVSLSSLNAVDRALHDFRFTQGDLRAIACEGEVLISVSQLNRLAQKYSHLESSSHRVTLMREELFKKLNSRLAQISVSEKLANEIDEMTPDEQTAIFGSPLASIPNEDHSSLLREFVSKRYENAFVQIENDQWIDVDKIGQRLLHSNGLTSLEWIYLKMGITGLSDTSMKYVMIDEVQDRTESELVIVSKYFRNAHFMLLGDPNQAIYEHTATFDQLKRIFQTHIGDVSECFLTTSYRSTAQITELFAPLAEGDAKFKIDSVRHSDSSPEILEILDDADYDRELSLQIDRLKESEGLSAIIVPWKQDAKRIAKLSGEEFQVLSDVSVLPNSGTIIVPLTLAKGLEFDAVLIPDASAKRFPSDEISRKRLYTTISRATKTLTMLSKGELSKLVFHS